MLRSRGSRSITDRPQIVDEVSATLGLPGGRETQIAVEANHSTICKFSSATDDTYEQVADNLVDLVDRAVEAVGERERLKTLIPPSTVPVERVESACM